MYIPYSEFVRPRKPREVVFAVGGWSGLYPTWVIETYDPRADRWINVIWFFFVLPNLLATRIYKKRHLSTLIFIIFRCLTPILWDQERIMVQWW